MSCDVTQPVGGNEHLAPCGGAGQHSGHFLEVVAFHSFTLSPFCKWELQGKIEAYASQESL